LARRHPATPTAIDSVTGRSYQRYANRLAPAANTTSATTTAMRSQIGSFIGKFRKKPRARRSASTGACQRAAAQKAIASVGAARVSHPH